MEIEPEDLKLLAEAVVWLCSHACYVTTQEEADKIDKAKALAAKYLEVSDE